MPLIDNNLYDLILTQKSINHKMPYDDIEKVIENAIIELKKENLNAKITNIVFNINGHLVLAQIYVERQNGFAPTKEAQFGTSPTSYNVQIRFPFGLEAMLGKTLVQLPSSDFEKILESYYKNGLNHGDIIDEVQRDTTPESLVCAEGVSKRIETRNGQEIVTIETDSQDQKIEFPITREMGEGYHKKPGCKPPHDIEYLNLPKYKARFKKHGVYPLFYFSKSEPQIGLLRKHVEYKDPAADTFLASVSDAILTFETGQKWGKYLSSFPNETYVLNLTIINGMSFFTHSNMPITRLRDYQLECFYHSLAFINVVNEQNNINKAQQGLAGLINMGVGSGKTFSIFTLLQYLRAAMQTEKLALRPAFCVAPNEAIAKVMGQSINRQGVTTGISSIAISNIQHFPKDSFLQTYQILVEAASIDAEKVAQYLDEELQFEIIDFCYQSQLHLNHIINFIWDKYSNSELEKRQSYFKESMDVKRLLLLVEGYKTIVKKTGMLGITALKDLLEQFKTLEKGLNETAHLLLSDATKNGGYSGKININYNQAVLLPGSMRSKSYPDMINIAQLDTELLRKILNTRFPSNLFAIRDVLLKITCLKDREAAILLANSGGLGNTYTQVELSSQIERLLPIAAELIRTLASQEKYSLEEHLLMHAYLNAFFSTIPDKLAFKSCYMGTSLSLRQDLYAKCLVANIKLVAVIKDKIQAKIDSLKIASQIAEINPDMLLQLG